MSELPPTTSESSKADSCELLDRLGVAGAGKAAPRRTGESGHPHRWIDRIKTLLWVVPLTLLIWVYAEREQVTTGSARLTVGVRSSAPDRVVMVQSGRDVELELKGPRAGLDALKNAISERSGPVSMVIAADEFPPGFEGTVPVAEWLGRHELFTEKGVTILRATPATVKVRVEEKVSREVPVRVNARDRVFDVTFQPDKVTIEGPKSVFDRVPPEQFVAFADLSRFLDRPPGRYDGDVNIALPFKDENVNLPRTVKASIELRPSQPVVVPRMPVMVLLPAGVLELDRFRIQAPVTITNVTVSGPPSVVQDLRDGKLSGTAIIDLTAADLKEGDLIKTLTPADYRLPPEVRVTEDRDITIRILSR